MTPCGICGCDDFASNPFKQKQKCNNCSHDHSKSIDDLPIWEREAIETREREDKEKREHDTRIKLREEAWMTISDRRVHKGTFQPWFKLVGTPKGFEQVEMGTIWTCCQATRKSSKGCINMSLSDLHEPCFRCGEQFFPFELPKQCRYHTGKLQWRDMGDTTKYRWECCDRLAEEEGCRNHFTHEV